MTKKRSFPTIDLSIQSFSQKGNGIGIYQHPSGSNWTVEVPFSMPGDVVKAKIYKKDKHRHLSFLEEVVTPSPLRQAPRCAHFGVCGGCRWQHVVYEEQLKQKEQHIRDCFKDLIDDTVDIRPIIKSEQPWEYRNKMEFSFSQNAAGEHFLGLIMDSSHGKVMNLSECHLVRGWFMTVLESVRNWWRASGLDAYHPYKDTGSLRVLTLREGMKTKDKMVVLTVSGNPDYTVNSEQLDNFVQMVRRGIEKAYPGDRLSIFLRIQQACKGMATNFYEMHLYGPDHIREILTVQANPAAQPDDFIFHISPSAFFQPNTYQAERFYSAALQLAGTTKDSIVYDLYCGTGTIGLCIAKHVRQVLGIEVLPDAALDAQTNASLNNINNYTIMCGAVRHLLKSVIDEKTFDPPDVLLINPPRVGLDPTALGNVLAVKAPKIIYMSCNPKTQAENAAALINVGYRIETLQPIDQYPQTVHFENIAVLTLS